MVGVNFGVWCLCVDWQVNYCYENDSEDKDNFGFSFEQNWDWNCYYVWWVILQFWVQLMLGEGLLEFDIFDGFNYVGGSFIIDDQMLLFNLCGYVLDILGVVCINVKVIVIQCGWVIYELQVLVGLFCIQDINEMVFGDLYVKIEE